MTEEVREEITPEQLVELQKRKPNGVCDVQVSGIAVIRDKDGNIKGKMEIVSLDEVEEVNDANH
jgi:hypothetical protein